MDFHSLTRQELQALCKKNKIPANMTNVAMANALKSLEIVEGLDERMNQYQSPERTVERQPATATRASTRRKLTKEPQSTQPTTQTRWSRTLASAGSKDEEKKTLNVPETPTMPTTRSRQRREASANLRLESQEMETEEQKGNILETPTTQCVPVSSVKRKEKRQEEASAQQVHSTRRSVRLLEKSLADLSLKDKRSLQSEMVKFDQMVEDQVEKKDAESGTSTGQALSQLLENESRDLGDDVQDRAGSEDSPGMGKINGDSEKSDDSDNVSGLHINDEGPTEPTRKTDDSHVHLGETPQPQDINDFCMVETYVKDETSEGNFMAVDIGSITDAKSVNPLADEASGMEVPQPAIAAEISGPIQDESTASENDDEDFGYEKSTRKDSVVDESRGLNDDEDQGRLQSNNGMTKLKKSYEKESNDSDNLRESYEKASNDSANLSALNSKRFHFVNDEMEEILSAEGGSDQSATFVEDQNDILASDDENVDNDDHGSDGSAGNEQEAPVAHEQKGIAIENLMTDVKTNEGEEFNITCNEGTPFQNEFNSAATNLMVPHGQEYPNNGALVDTCVMPAEEFPECPRSLENSLSAAKQIYSWPLVTSTVPISTESVLPQSTQSSSKKQLTIQKMNQVDHNDGTLVDIYVMPAEEFAGCPRSLENSPSPVKQMDPWSLVPTTVPISTESEFPQPTQSSPKKPLTIQKMDEVDHNKENIGRSVKKLQTPELAKMSIRGLKKLLAEQVAKLDINDGVKNTEEDRSVAKLAGKVRPPLQALSDHRMPGGETEENI